MLSAERAFPYVGGADTEVVRHSPALACGCTEVAPAFFDTIYPLRGRPVWGLCSCPSSLVQHASRTALLHVELPNVGDLVGILILLREGGVALWLSREKARRAFPLPGIFVSPPSPVRTGYPAPSPSFSVARWMDVGRLSSYFLSWFITIASIFLRTINTSSIPPCPAFVIVGCSWLLFAVLELFVGMCLATNMFSPFLFADIICWDVLRIRPVVLFTPSLVAELSSRVSRRLFFCAIKWSCY
jgi:hypothetical protein